MTDYERRDPDLAYQPADQGFDADIEALSDRRPD
jgi:hypothetical protein